MSQIALETRMLAKSFGSFQVLRDATLAVREGDCVGIIGPNGAGKTTFLNLLTGSLTPTSGVIAIYGQDVTAVPPYKRARSGLIKTSQLTSLFPGLTIRENLAIALYAAGAPTPKGGINGFEAETYELLQLLDLDVTLDNEVGALSHGEQRVLEIALGLAMKPKILVLDEPTAGMSPRETAKFTALVTERLRGRTTLIIIEHDMEVMKTSVDKLAVLHQGRFIAFGDVDLIMQDPVVNEVYLGNDTKH